MGSFFTAALCPKDAKGDVQKLLQAKSYYAVERAQDDYCLVAEKEMDMQDAGKIKKFCGVLSKTTKKPVFSFMVHDSDVLWFSIFLKGEQIYLFSNEDEYFGINIEENGDIPVLLGVSKDEWEKLSNKEKIQEYDFAEDYLADFLKLFKLPSWAVGIGYNYLDNDLESFEFDDKFKIEKHKAAP